MPMIEAFTEGGFVAVTVDREPLAVKELGLNTVGQVLAHLQKANRLVVQVLIDGQEPEPGELSVFRRTELNGHSVFIETADPRTLALQVLDEVTAQIEEAGPLKDEAAELLQQNQMGKAMEKLGGCLRSWQNARDSIAKTAELLRFDPGSICVEGVALEAILAGFAEKLRAIKGALEQRDYVLLSDILMYETADMQRHWAAAVEAMRGLVKNGA